MLGHQFSPAKIVIAMRIRPQGNGGLARHFRIREIELRCIHRGHAGIGPEPVLGRTVGDKGLLDHHPLLNAACIEDILRIAEGLSSAIDRFRCLA